MGPLAAYSIKSAILLALMLAIYIPTLGRLKAANIRRSAILCICILSLIIPLFYAYRFSDDSLDTAIELTPPTRDVITSAVSTPAIYTIIAISITTGIFAAAIVSILGLARLIMMRKRTAYLQGYKLNILTDGHTSPFCFCGSIYISEEDFSQLPEMILAHESSHISHLHFIDLFIGRILLIIQWWNPMAWLLIKEMQRVHEYQADGDVVEAGYDHKEYQYLLLKRAVGDTRFSLVNGFRHSELRSRLKMINREKTGRKKSITLLMMLATASCVALALPITPIASFINDNFTDISLSSLRQQATETTTKTSDSNPHVILNGSAMPYESMINVNPQAIKSITVRKDNPEHPNGVIEIETKPGMDIYDHSDSHKLEDIKVFRAETIRKE